MKRSRLTALALLWAVSAHAQSAITVTVDNYVRAESDVSFAGVVKMGGFGKLAHLREPAPLDKQFVVRPNRDTLYSNGIFALALPRRAYPLSSLIADEQRPDYACIQF